MYTGIVEYQRSIGLLGRFETWRIKQPPCGGFMLKLSTSCLAGKYLTSSCRNIGVMTYHFLIL